MMSNVQVASDDPVVSTSPEVLNASEHSSTSSAKDELQQQQDDEMDEEEALLLALEQQQEENLLVVKQPTCIDEAPKLLQDALKKGEVKSDDEDEPTKQEEKKGDEGDSKLEHHRVVQLEYLLNKASEYSSFISRDLQELQDSLADKARRAVKKRKSSSKDGFSTKEGSTKRQKKNDASAAAFKNAQEKDAKARTGTGKAIFVQPANLAEECVLKDYQLEGVRWLVSLFENGVSGVLADEMGLGKTIQVIALIGHLLTQNVSGPFLVVAPLATLPNWVREFEKWLPHRPVVRYHGPAPEREAMLRGCMNPKDRRMPTYPFIVTSFEVAIRDQKVLEKLGPFTYLIVDEGHRLKNHRCTLLQSLKKINAQNRLLLSGTPIQNNLDELWSLLNFVNPQIFDDLSVFQSWFGFRDIGQKNSQKATSEEEVLIEQKKNQTVSKLHHILRPFLLRRIKTDVLKDMPPKKEVIVYSGMSKLQKGYADLIENGVLRDQLVAQGIEAGRTLSQTNKQMNHRKNINHPFLFGEPMDPATGVPLGTAYPHLLVRASGKFALLDRMLERLFKDKHQALIFSQMTALLNVIEDYLIYRKWKYCRIDGSTNIDERQRQMDVYNNEKTSGSDGGRNESDDRYFVFLLSTRAGGLGINLTSADTCIIFDSDWNPHQDSQAMDRCHRIGQTRPVAVYRLLTVNSVDIDMMQKQISKKKLERMTIAGGEFKTPGSRRGALSENYLTSLLTDDIQNLDAKGEDVENVTISAEEFDFIMDRKKLFSGGDDAIPVEGKMYDILEAASGDVLGAMNA